MLPQTLRITQNPGQELNTFLASKEYSQVFVILDNNTRKLCYSVIKPLLPEHTVIETMAGEAFKNLETCSFLWQEFTRLKADRHAVVIVLGGGVLGDLAGFCAATFKRGIDFILVPTTLLAQCDASIGGKLGIDFEGFKNHLGVFQQPALTLLYSGFLKTLPEIEIRSGFAEVIKHALISDSALWKEIRNLTLADQNWDKLIEHSANFKYSIIEKDPTEKGLRKVLNAGHTIGHAIESYFLQKGKSITHGEAVAAGLVAEAFLSFERGFLSLTFLEEIRNYVLNTFGKLDFTEIETEAIGEFALQDKKNKGKEILCVLIMEKGDAKWDYVIQQVEIKEALLYYLKP
jgi:3-dehydroquinate synthase